MDELPQEKQVIVNALVDAIKTGKTHAVIIVGTESMSFSSHGNPIEKLGMCEMISQQIKHQIFRNSSVSEGQQ